MEFIGVLDIYENKRGNGIASREFHKKTYFCL